MIIFYTFFKRLSTVRNADKIIALKDGRVHEEGTHDQLMKEKGLYFSLVTAQTDADEIDNNDGDIKDLEGSKKLLHL